MEWNIEHKKAGDIIVLLPERQMLTDTPEDFLHYVEGLLRLDELKIVVDLAKAEWLNSLGLGILASCHKIVNKAEGRFVLCNLSEKIKTAMKISYLSRILTITENEDEAMEKCNE